MLYMILTPIAPPASQLAGAPHDHVQHELAARAERRGAHRVDPHVVRHAHRLYMAYAPPGGAPPRARGAPEVACEDALGGGEGQGEKRRLRLVESDMVLGILLHTHSSTVSRLSLLCIVE